MIHPLSLWSGTCHFRKKRYKASNGAENTGYDMTQRTLFLLDVGNTNVKIGIADRSGLHAAYTLPTNPAETADAWGLRLLEVRRAHGLDSREAEAFVVSSVVPPMDPLLARAAERFFGCPALFVPRDLPIPLENRYERPHECGADRLVTAYAARRLFDAEKIIVVDYGTATTFDCISGNAMLGGLICPGVLSSARALSGGTAKLPHITLELDEGERDGVIPISKNTATSLTHGLIHGFAAMTEGLCARLAPALDAAPGEALVVGTGGFAEKIRAVCPALGEVRGDLLMEGLRMLYLESVTDL